MTAAELEKHFSQKLETTFDADEAHAVCRLILDELLMLQSPGTDYHSIAVEDAVARKAEEAVQRVLQHEPVQYVLGSCWFCNLKLYVNHDVLIPRPETEELVHLIGSEVKSRSSRILDVGTGSGCIALALKKLLPDATIAGIDISEDALTVARTNAMKLKLAVNFHHLDIFNYRNHADFIHTYEKFDIIASNPPYIRESEKDHLDERVRLHEPASALFVADDDAIIYYKAIADFAHAFLHKNGKLFFEVHQQRMNDVSDMLRDNGFTSVAGLKDLSGNDRFVQASF
jgi:release factor glutamine methyltransferase